MRLLHLGLLLSLLTLSGCNPFQARLTQADGGAALVQGFLDVGAPLAPYRIGEEYTVGAAVYTPNENLQLRQTGGASYYSDVLIGALTASGEFYDAQQFTAAHKTLPIQTLVRVTNVANNRSVVVRINDRGPFVKGRIIDLSAQAATHLGMLRTGLADVEIEVLQAETELFRAALKNGRVIPTQQNSGASEQPTVSSLTQTPAQTLSFVQAPLGNFYVLVGTYITPTDVNAIRDRVSRLGNVAVETNGQFYEVYIGPLSTALDAQSILARVFAEGATNARVVQR